MSDMIPYRGEVLSPAISGTPGPVEIGAALRAFDKALETAVQIAKNSEDAKTERALIQARKEMQLEAILAQKETQIAQIEADTRRGMNQDRLSHERRMYWIHIIRDLILNNAENLNPEIMNAARFLLEALREER